MPALNDLLQPYGIAFGAEVWTGSLDLAPRDAQSHLRPQRVKFASGPSIRTFPAGGKLMSALMHNKGRALTKANPDSRYSQGVPVEDSVDRFVPQSSTTDQSGPLSLTEQRDLPGSVDVVIV